MRLEGCLRCPIHRSPVEEVSLKISKARGAFALLNQSVTRDSSFVDDFLVPRGWLRCQIPASPVEAFC
jgi:hypothetical protein